MVTQGWMDIIKSWLGRKMIIFYISITSLFVMTLWNKMDGNSFLIGVLALGGASVGANLINKKFDVNNPTGKDDEDKK